MDIAVALSRQNRRDITLNAGDEETISLTVYRVDGDDTPLTTEVTNAAFNLCPGIVSMTVPVGSQFTVPDTYERSGYTLTADIDGVRRTLCSGVLWIKGARAWPSYGWDYGGPWGWGW